MSTREVFLLYFCRKTDLKKIASQDQDIESDEYNE